MVETSKQVRVDNWGIYFLQRLQLFFSKTDYCDLTLQFEGNVQLKVHRLVMNACTEYFAFLEQTCPALEENTIMMPTDLQADVIVPIVNFMYTGMLEYHSSIFDKLYKASETMNIAVLTKLLEAQVTPAKSNVKPKKEISNNWTVPAKRGPKPLSPPVNNDLPTSLPGRKLPVWKRRQPSTPLAHPVSATFSNTKWISEPAEKDPLMIFDNTPKPTRFEWPDDDLPPITPMDPSFDDVSLTSKPLWTKEDDQKAAPSFEEACSIAQENRHTSLKNNSMSQDSDEDFPQKEHKVNVSKHLDESENPLRDSLLKRKSDSKITSSPKRVKITDQEDETVISIKTNNPGELDHTKIVSEILKKFPELVKKKKNIKLKIISAKNEQPHIKVQTVKEKPKPQVVLPEEKPLQVATKKVEPELIKEPETVKENLNPPLKPSKSRADFRCFNEDGPWMCVKCLEDNEEAPEFVLYYLFRKHMTDVHGMEFDSSLCKYCGKKCSTELSMAYHLYTKHGLIPPRNISFPKCPQCPFIGVSTDRINEHVKIHGKDEVQCQNCKLGFFTKKDLTAHMQITGHNNQSSKPMIDCPYCMKKHQSPVGLFTHVHSQHIKEATRDGITSLKEKMDIDEEAPNTSQVEEPPTPLSTPVTPIINRTEERQPKDRVNIISNVKVTKKIEENKVNSVVNATEQVVEAEPEHIAVATTTATTLSNITGSLATNLAGLVDIVVLDDNQQYILQQPQGQTGNAEFILPELATNEGILQATATGTNINSTDELVMVLTDHDYQDEQNQGQTDNSNIVVLYSHPVEGQQGQFITSQGNLLVNSDGMLEIRNGAGITTTAGQILVNSNGTTTTTQATASPIESIELIRKEIEEGSAEIGGKKAVLKFDENKSTDNERKVEENNSEQNEKEVIKETIENNDVLDTSDSIQEVPMEVEDIEPQKENSLIKNHEEEENQEQILLPETKDTKTSELTPVENTEESETQDVLISETQNISTDENLEISPVSSNDIFDEPAKSEKTGDADVEHMESQTSTELKDEVEINEPKAGSPSTVEQTDTSLSDNVSTPQNEKVKIIETETETSTKEILDEQNQNSSFNEHKESDSNAEVPHHNQNEDFDDFTDESQQSANQKVHKDLNKEILEDWDDTDSQQSQKSNDVEEDGQEIGPDQEQVINEAAENVNKLMDDWDDDEEEQEKVDC